MELEGRVVVVTGATGALGRAVARAAAGAGARVFPVYLLPADDAAATELAALGRGRAHRADVSRPEDVSRVFDAIRREADRVDGLVNTVGAWDGGAPLAEVDPERWHRMVEVNLTTAMLCCRAALPGMLAAGWGRIVNVGSRAASRPVGGQAAYNAAKAALAALTETLAEETRGRGVNVNAVLPSTIDTPANRASMPGADPGAWTRPERIADVVAFLLSDASAAVTGALIPVTGTGR